METEQTQEDLLVSEPTLVMASTAKRFFNYLIDVIGFYATLFIIGILIAVVSPATADSIGEDGGFGFGDRLLALLLYALFMSVVEAVFKGKSLGKLVTGTRAVYEDGSRISTATAFKKGLS